ncbi:alpha-2,3-sialyltransferase [Bisgaard Taxon 45]
MNKFTKHVVSKKVAVVAGNGQSLAEIDYSLLPEKYDVFRCNQFYFEERYFLGKKLKAVFFTPEVFLEQYYTLYHLKQNNEYFVDEIILSSFNHPTVDLEQNQKIQNLFVDAINGYENYLAKLTAFDVYLRYKELYENQRITSGVYMCAVAIAMGYTDIYLTGIDFYQSNKEKYAFDYKQPNILHLLPDFQKNKIQFDYHHEHVDLEALHFLQEHYQVNLYSLSPTSPLSEHFPAPPVEANGEVTFVAQQKENYIHDILLPPRSVYEKLGLVVSKKERFHSNLIVRLIRDVLKLPSVLKHYLREK